MALYDVLGNLIAGGTLFADAPVGVINPFGGTTAPEGWLLCNGQAISRTDYADLFAVIGTAFGSGDGSTTFNVPDFRESVPKGAGLTGKSSNHMDADGLAVGEFLDDRVQTHKHAGPSDGLIINSVASGINGGQLGTGIYWKNGAQYVTGNNNGRSGATTEVKSVGVNFIIKSKHVSLPADFLAEIQDLLDSKNILTYGSD